MSAGPSFRPVKAQPPTASTAPTVELEWFLIEERQNPQGGNGVRGDGAMVYFARVPDPARLIAERQMHLHDDVVEVLTDLLLDLVGCEEAHGSDTGG